MKQVVLIKGSNNEVIDHYDDTYEFEIKLPQEEKYHKVLVTIEYDEVNERLYLPRGIDIWFVEKYIGAAAKVDYNHDSYERIGDVYIKYLPRNDVQKESLRFMLGEGEYKDWHNAESIS